MTAGKALGTENSSWSFVNRKLPQYNASFLQYNTLLIFIKYAALGMIPPQEMSADFLVYQREIICRELISGKSCPELTDGTALIPPPRR